MGALIDFSTGVACFKSIAPNVLVQLERASNGHLYMSLADNLLENEVTEGEAVDSLVPVAEHILRLATAAAARRRGRQAEGALHEF
jgi:hypothetical protein